MRPHQYLLILLIVLLPAGPFATTFPVTKTDDTNDGTCDADCSLREAIEAANANVGADDVPVPAGIYLLGGGQLVVSDDVTITGAGQESTIIDGNAWDRVFGIQSGVVAEISDVTLQNGSVVSLGGGISNTTYGGGISNAGVLTLTNTTVSGNGAGYFGGGIFNEGDLTLTNSTVSGNYVAVKGAGIFSSGALTLNNSAVSGNHMHYLYGPLWFGGGIYNSGTAALSNSTVSHNLDAQIGAGILNIGDLTLTNSTVSGNDTGYGIDGRGGTVILTNSTVSRNTSGGIVNRGDLTLTNSTVSGNFLGRGISSWAGIAHLANSVVADNKINCGGVTSLGYNLADDTSCGLTAPGDLVVADAMLGPLQDNGGPTETHDLLPGSPAIDAGSMDCPPPDTDQRGVARPQGSACDIGAVEYTPEPHCTTAIVAGAALLAMLYRRRRYCFER